MRCLTTLILLAMLSLPALAQSGNPLLDSAAPAAEATAAVADAAAVAPETETFAFPDSGFDLVMPTGGYLVTPEDEGWDYSESAVCEWRHDDNMVYSALIAVTEFESPITTTEFEMLAELFREEFTAGSRGASDLSELRLTTRADRPWYSFAMKLVLEDGTYAEVQSWTTYLRNRQYRVTCFYDPETVIDAPGDAGEEEVRRVASLRLLEVIDGVQFHEPVPLAELELVEFSVPEHGLRIKLPHCAEMIPTDSPDLAAMAKGPFNYSFLTQMAELPAHGIVWCFIEKETPYPAQEWRAFVDSVWMGTTGYTQLTPAPLEVIQYGDVEWTRGNAGIVDPEEPEANYLLYMCQTPGGMQMVIAKANNGYVEQAIEQMALIFATAQFSRYDVPERDWETFSIADIGFSISLPGGGWPSFPGDEDWEYADKEQIRFEWLHIDSPLNRCRYFTNEISSSLVDSDYRWFGEGIIQVVMDEYGAESGSELPQRRIGDYNWHAFEFKYGEDRDFLHGVIYVLTEFKVLHGFYFEYSPEDREAALEVAEQALATFTLE